MSKKIRQLRALLLKAGCRSEKAKGSHTKWTHPKLHDALILSGADRDDAKPYQEAAVLRFVQDIPEEK
ncbi:type II toxin-antitoxin system HicA family toxin [uncultured Thiodictyon sp.]|uniref:type II toxin-antitoxin system HicA family toxin n=1 Tax=uncultured Thiodictyon sp. TaxID=1846217 RepID=UPI0025E0BC8E|nr:type II toxin-antitoxin system HicA family toxin [uncultured Thiodictyon sp.]